METLKDSRLPKAKFLEVHWQGWWFRQVIYAVGKERRYWPRFFTSTRGANYMQVWIGPVTFSWRRPWFRWQAEGYLKQLEEHF